MIELRQLRYLIAAAEAGSFSRAARNLNIKQPTLSRYILETEKRLGMALFDRKTRGATLTADGATYLRIARRIMKEWDELDAWVSAKTNGHAGKLTVGFYTSVSAGNLRATLSEFGERHREVKMRGFERDREMLLTGIENGSLDIAIMIGEAPHRIRQCAHPDCVLFFYDTSKNGTRRWHSMATCGNRAKAARHRARVRSS